MATTTTNRETIMVPQEKVTGVTLALSVSEATLIYALLTCTTDSAATHVLGPHFGVPAYDIWAALKCSLSDSGVDVSDIEYKSKTLRARNSGINILLHGSD